MMFKLLKIFGMKEGEHIPIPSEQKATQDIQEPVISFIKCFKANPKRFKIRTLNPNVRQSTSFYEIVDKDNSEVFNFNVGVSTITGFNGDTCNYLELNHLILSGNSKIYLTDNECGLLVSELYNIINRTKEKDRVNRINKGINKKVASDERERLTNIYK